MSIHQKWMCVFFNKKICPKSVVLKKNSSLLSSLVFIFSPPQNIPLKKWLWHHFSITGPCLFLLEHFICLSHCNIRWTTSANDVGLTIYLMGTSNFMITPTLLSLVHTEVIHGRVQQPITDFTKTLEQLHCPWSKQPLVEPNPFIGLGS
jgi:hypothetical protein